MKKLALFLGFLTMIGLTAVAQEDYENNDIQTLVGANQSVGGYGAISMQYTELQDRDAFVFGARGGITMGHMITLGLGGSGFFNDVQYNDATGTDISLAGGYGGFFFEPIIMPRFPVHVSFPILLGAGGVGVMSSNEDDNWDENFKSEASDAFMVIEPGIEIELNITRFFRFCVGGYYRYTTDVDIHDPVYDIPTDILRGFSGGVTFKFGRF
jgi:hypothetical protein